MPTEPSVHSQSTSRPNGRESDVASPYKGFATRAIRIGQDPDSATGSTIVPIYQTATFTQQAVGVHKGFDYGALGKSDPRCALERQLANLESARFGIAFGSGMAAAHAVTSLLSQGDHIVATRDIYGGVHRLLTVDHAALRDHDDVRRHDRPRGGARRGHAGDEAVLGRDADQSALDRDRHSPPSPRCGSPARSSRSTTRSARRSCSGRSSSAPTSPGTRRPSTSTATATWSAASSSPTTPDIHRRSPFIRTRSARSPVRRTPT